MSIQCCSVLLLLRWISVVSPKNSGKDLRLRDIAFGYHRCHRGLSCSSLLKPANPQFPSNYIDMLRRISPIFFPKLSTPPLIPASAHSILNARISQKVSLAGRRMAGLPVESTPRAIATKSSSIRGRHDVYHQIRLDPLRPYCLS